MREAAAAQIAAAEMDVRESNRRAALAERELEVARGGSPRREDSAGSHEAQAAAVRDAHAAAQAAEAAQARAEARVAALEAQLVAARRPAAGDAPAGPGAADDSSRPPPTPSVAQSAVGPLLADQSALLASREALERHVSVLEAREAETYEKLQAALASEAESQLRISQMQSQMQSDPSTGAAAVVGGASGGAERAELISLRRLVGWSTDGDAPASADSQLATTTAASEYVAAVVGAPADGAQLKADALCAELQLQYRCVAELEEALLDAEARAEHVTTPGVDHADADGRGGGGGTARAGPSAGMLKVLYGRPDDDDG